MKWSTLAQTFQTIVAIHTSNRPHPSQILIVIRFQGNQNDVQMSRSLIKRKNTERPGIFGRKMKMKLEQHVSATASLQCSSFYVHCALNVTGFLLLYELSSSPPLLM